MQGLTRNPFADPGLLGVNAGASVGGAAGDHTRRDHQPAGLRLVRVRRRGGRRRGGRVIGSRGPDGANPAKLALTGAAVTAGLTAVTLLILTTQSAALDVYRYWSVGCAHTRGDSTRVALVLVPLLVGSGPRALLRARPGPDRSRRRHRRPDSVTASRVHAASASWPRVLLAGGATAIAGPIVFLGLVVPHALRAVLGGSYGRLLLDRDSRRRGPPAACRRRRTGHRSSGRSPGRRRHRIRRGARADRPRAARTAGDAVSGALDGPPARRTRRTHRAGALGSSSRLAAAVVAR